MDEKLIERARTGDHAAFRTLVEKHQRKAFAVALGIVRNRDDAQDICQEAFLRAHRALPTFDGDSQFFTWLYRIVYNLSIDHLRKRRFDLVSFDEAQPAGDLDNLADETDPLRSLRDEQLRARILEALETLSPAHRAVITLREVEGLSYKQIAEVVGCSVGTVMSRLFHARRNLQRALTVEHEELDLAA